MSEVDDRNADAASRAPAAPGTSGGNGIARPAAAAVLRGELRKTNQMENLHVAYIHAVAAAAGCTVATFNTDNGIDCQMVHRSQTHVPEPDARLEIQLKATHRVSPTDKPKYVSVQLKNERYRLYAVRNPTVPKIVVAMTMPADPADWILATHDLLSVRHCSYWVNIAGMIPTGKDETIVRVPTEQVFDDLALCDIMSRIGQGGAP